MKPLEKTIGPARLLLLAIFVLLSVMPVHGQSADSWDPVTMDPPPGALAPPPSSVSFKFASSGSLINATMYLAGGPGPHATVVLLHGWPGNERNLDLAQALRRAGYHVLTMNYRGAWGSGGVYSYRHAVEDALAALVFLRSAEARDKYGVDAGRLLLCGHSVGGYVALQAGASDPSVRAVAAIAPMNENQRAAALRVPATRDALFARFKASTDVDSGPLRVESLDAMVDHVPGYDFLDELKAWHDRPVLLVASTRDATLPIAEHHQPIEHALRTAGVKEIETVIFDDDHVFSAHRIGLTRTVVEWFRKTVAP